MEMNLLQAIRGVHVIALYKLYHTVYATTNNAVQLLL